MVSLTLDDKEFKARSLRDFSCFFIFAFWPPGAGLSVSRLLLSAD